MPRVTPGDTVVDWDHLARSWGRPFPADYRRLIDTYGAGYIADHLVIGGPEPKADPGPNGQGMNADTALAERFWHDARHEPDLDGLEPRLIAWGGNSAGDQLCWDATDEDPDRWPVLMWARGDDMWSRHDCGMAAFLVRVMTADFPECPLSDLTLWGREGATFLTRTEYMRRLKAGLDPWTLEPDPYADMFDWTNHPDA